MTQKFREILSKMYNGLHVRYPLYLSDFNETSIFSADFRKILRTSNFMEIRPVRAQLSHADTRTDRHDEVNSRFLQFCERA